MFKVLLNWKTITDYLNKVPLTIYIIFGVVVLVLLFFLLRLLLFRPNKISQRFARARDERNIRRFTLDYKNNTVRYFDRWNIKHFRVISTERFLQKFSSLDQKRISVWLKELEKPNHMVPHVLECQIYINPFRMNVDSILQATSINYQKKLIHLESHLLFEVSKTMHYKRNRKMVIRSLEEVKRHVQRLADSEPVNIFLVRFYNNSEFSEEENVSSILISQLINRLVKLMNPKRDIMISNSNEILIVDYKEKRKNDVYALGYSIEKEIIKFIKINSLGKDYDFQIGITCQKGSRSNVDDMILIARQTSKYSQQSDYSDHVMIFDETINLAQNYRNVMVGEIAKIIENNEFAYMLSPLFEIKVAKMAGLACEFISTNSKIKSLREIFEFARLSNNDFHLYDLLIKNSLLNYQNIGGKSLLSNKHPFMIIDLPITYSEILKKFETALINASKQIQPVFCISDLDLENWVKEGNDLENLLKIVKKSDSALALKISHFGTESIEKCFKDFTFAIVDEALVKDIAKDTQTKVFLNDLLNKLHLNKLQIIAFNITSMPTIEALIKLKIDYISSTLLCPKSKDNIGVPNKKRVEKLKA